MEVRQVAENVSVAGQLTVEDVREAARLGFRTLISNRPDSESGAVPHEEIRKAAEAAGMKFHYIPVVSGSLTDTDAEAMARALEESEGPVLAYCRSGGRSAALHKLATEG